MSYTLDQKYDFNIRRMHTSKDVSEVSFSSGYCMGVACYQGYGKGNAEDMKRRRRMIADAERKARKGDIYCKGIMCGVRDAANERKARKGK